MISNLTNSTLRDNCPYTEFFSFVFPAFGLNMERYGVCLRIHSKCGKILTRKTPNTVTFHAVALGKTELLRRSSVTQILRYFSP